MAAPGSGDRCWMGGIGALVRYVEAELAKSEAGQAPEGGGCGVCRGARPVLS